MVSSKSLAVTFAFSAIVALSNGCMSTPVDGTRVSNQSASMAFAGYGDQPGAAVSVEAFFPAGGYYYPIANATTVSSPLSKWNRSWYAWSTSGAVPSWGWERLGNGYFARVRSSQGDTVLNTLRSEFYPCLSSNDSSLLTFVQNCVSYSTPSAFLYSTDYPHSVSELLATCPTTAERNRVMNDFDVEFGEGVSTSYSCTPGGSEGSPTLNLVNAMRALKFIRFNEPMPVLEVTNIYDWMVAANVQIRIFHDGPGENSNAGGRTINLKESIMTGNRRTFGSPGVLLTITGLIVHESRHTTGGGNIGHNCGSNDSSLEYGGAWAAQYWYYRWLVDHTGSQLSSAEKLKATEAANGLLDNFCD
jgi:hypothetical protein